MVLGAPIEGYLIENVGTVRQRRCYGAFFHEIEREIQITHAILNFCFFETKTIS